MGSGGVFRGQVREAQPCQDLWAVVRRQEGGWRVRTLPGPASPCAPCTRKVPWAAQLPADPQGGGRKCVLTSVDLVPGLFTSCFPACGWGWGSAQEALDPAGGQGGGGVGNVFPTHLCPQHDSHFSIFHAIPGQSLACPQGACLSAQPLQLLCCVNSGEWLPAKPCLPEPWMDTLCLSARLL